MARLGFLDRLRGRKPTPRLGVAGDAKGIASRFLGAPSVRAHLDGTRHFGILKPPDDIDIDRLAYVELQCSILLRLKERYAGYGLGSKLDVGGGQATGLELCQLWAVLGSWGHLWGTFATERALAFNVFHAGLGEALLSLIPEADRAACRTEKLHVSMYRLHECIAALLLASPLDGVTDADRAIAGAAWSVYLRRDRGYSTLLRAYRFARKVAFVQLHNRVGISRVGEVHAPEDAFARPDPLDGFHDAVELRALPQTSPFERLLDAVERYEYETFFAGTESATLVLEHLRVFKVWWDARGPRDAATLRAYIIALRERPSDWPRERTKHALAHVARLTMPAPGAEWPADVGAWWANGTPWGGANFYLSIMPRGTTSMLDVYRAEGDPHLAPAPTTHVIDRLHQLSNIPGRPNPSLVQLIDKAAGTFLVAKVHERMEESFRLELEPTPSSKEHRPTALVEVGVWGNAFLKAARGEAEKFTDAGRQRELLLFIDEARKQHAVFGDSACRAVLLLGIARVLSNDDREVTELDGLLLLASPTAMSILVAECKHTQRPRMGAQTRRFADIFRGSVEEVQTRKGGGAAISIWSHRFP